MTTKKITSKKKAELRWGWRDQRGEVTVAHSVFTKALAKRDAYDGETVVRVRVEVIE